MKKIKILILLPIIFLFLFSSCKKDNVAPDPSAGVTPAMARDSLYNIMKDVYLWYDMPEAKSVTTANKDNYKDPYELLEAMRYKKLDRWSRILDYDKFMADLQGTFVGHGFRIGIDQDNKARIVLIYNKSNLYANGVRRGWIVKKINNTDPVPALLNGTYSTLIGPSTAGITNIFVFTKPDGTDVTISTTKSTFTMNTVLLYDTLHLSSGITGQLVFESFYNPAPEELATAFAFFKANNIKDLILDLRYNPGGDLNIAQTLASYIAGNSRKGTTFAKLLHNDKYQSYNVTIPFNTTANPVTITKLVVITSRSTASASEDVINGLKPLIDVVSIGDTTDGKPTGMYSWYIGKKYAMLPVTFKVVNSLNQGDFFGGIIPSKLISDDITRDFDDRKEKDLEEAIHYLETGSFSTKGETMFKRYPQFSEKPEWRNNAFILKK
jgi:carboxyl-terminal processing protease